MRIKQAAVALVSGLAAVTAFSAFAQAQDPLSAIGWLETSPDVPYPPNGLLLEPPIAEHANGAQITVTPLDKLLPSIGLVAANKTGLPVSLWQDSPPSRLAELIRNTPADGLPALQSLLLTLLLAEARAPFDDNDRVLLARVERLIDIGATDPAQALLQEAGPTESVARFSHWFDVTLLNGDEDRSCAALTARPYLNPDYAARIFCAVRRGDWPMAALMLDVAGSLQLLASGQPELLDRFLNPEFFEGAAPLPSPKSPSPLTFRLFEAIGEPMPTTSLPRGFANADLRDLAGWKAQLEAAERLTRSRAMSPNQLLGLFTERQPAASGGIWDRVQAIQELDRALTQADSEAVTRALPNAWEAARYSGLELAAAELFAERLKPLPLSGDAASLAWRMQLLSSNYREAAQVAPDQSRKAIFLASLAQGVPSLSDAVTSTERAIAAGFKPSRGLPAAQKILLDENRLGEAILVTLRSFAHGADGNLEALTLSIAALRHMGLEDTARRASLQLLLLDPN